MASQTALVSSEDMAALDALVDGFAAKVRGCEQRFQSMFLTAEAVQKMRQMLPAERMRPVMALQGSRLGFVTDKDKDGGYPMETVRECLIEAVLRGVYPVGNEFNIIKSAAYVTKAGFSRLIRQYPGLSGFKFMIGVPKTTDGGSGAIIPCWASWKIEGRDDALGSSEEPVEIPVKRNKDMGIDALLGKAERKLKARVYERITGSVLSDGEVEILNVTNSMESETLGVRKMSSYLPGIKPKSLEGKNSDAKDKNES